jgi:outer membrane cobalamin receptor
MRPFRSLLVFAALVFTLLPALGRAMEIQVLDTQGGAITGASLVVREAVPSGRSASALTDARGTVRVGLKPPLEIRVAAPGFEPLQVRQESVPPGPLALRLQPATLRTTVDVVVRDTPTAGTVSTSVGSALEIDRSGARTVLDAVEKLVPSAFVTRRGVMGYGIATNGTGMVSIRGVGESPNTGVLIVIDGRPDYQGLMGHPLPDFYSLSDAASIRVTQGPASVLYGTNALGGAIEITPARPREGVHTELSSSFGSYATGLHRFAHGAKWGRGYYSLTAGLAHTSGDRPNSAFHDEDGTVAIGYELSPSWRTSLQGRYGHFNVEDPGTVENPSAGAYARVERGGFSYDLDNTSDRTWGFARVFSSFGHHMIWDGFRSVDNTTGIRLHQTVSVVPQLTLDGGTDVVRYGGRANNIAAATDFGEHHLTDAAGFTRAVWTPLNRLRFNAGFRYQHNSLFGGIAVPEFGGSLRLTDRYSLSASAGRGFRNPTIRELYLFPAPNPALRPEFLWNYQATFQARPRAGITTWLTGYYADLSDLIVVTGRFPNLQTTNAGRALNRGMEANLRWQASRRLSLTSGYGYLRSTNLAPYLPAQKLNYALEWDAGRAFIHLGGMTVGRRWADLTKTSQLGGYTLLTLKCTVPLRRDLSVSVMTDNLLNRRYEVIPGYPMPGINAMAGFDWRF